MLHLRLANINCMTIWVVVPVANKMYIYYMCVFVELWLWRIRFDFQYGRIVLLARLDICPLTFSSGADYVSHHCRVVEELVCNLCYPFRKNWMNWIWRSLLTSGFVWRYVKWYWNGNTYLDVFYWTCSVDIECFRMAQAVYFLLYVENMCALKELVSGRQRV